MSKISTSLKRLIGRIWMKAAYWTAIGTMLIPLGVLLAIEKPEWSEWALGLIITGLASFIAGWVYTISDEKRRQREEKRREEEYKLRIREGKTTILTLTSIAGALGVDMNKFLRNQRNLLERGEEDDDM